LGKLSAEEMRRSALLHLVNMGVKLCVSNSPMENVAGSHTAVLTANTKES
jgi:hypothetical protein